MVDVKPSDPRDREFISEMGELSSVHSLFTLVWMFSKIIIKKKILYSIVFSHFNITQRKVLQLKE